MLLVCTFKYTWNKKQRTSISVSVFTWRKTKTQHLDDFFPKKLYCLRSIRQKSELWSALREEPTIRLDPSLLHRSYKCLHKQLCVGVDDWSFFFFGKLKERKRKKNKTHLIAILYTALYITLFTSVQQGKITKWFRTIWWKVLFVFFPSSSFPSLPPSFILKLMVHVGRKNTLRFARQKHPHACDIEHKA